MKSVRLEHPEFFRGSDMTLIFVDNFRNVWLFRELLLSLPRELKTRGNMFGSLLLFGIGMQEILVIALIVLLLFGGKKIPELMKGLGKGVKSFKEGMNEVTDLSKDEKKSEESERWEGEK